MQKIPKELHYTSTHEWVRLESDGTFTVGITDYAQDKLGELIHVGLPEVDEQVHAFDEVCALESVKTATDVFSPLSGKIVAVNEELEEAPTWINSDPYGDGWLFRLAPSDREEAHELLDHKHYLDQLDQDED